MATAPLPGRTGPARPKPKKKTRRTPRQIVRGVRRRARRAAGRVRRVWRRSLQLRVVTSTLFISMTVVAVLGFFLMQMIDTAVLRGRVDSATSEARANVTTLGGYLEQPSAATPPDAPARDGGPDTAFANPVDQAAYAMAQRADSRYSVVILNADLVGSDRVTDNLDPKSVTWKLRDAVLQNKDEPRALYTPMYYVGRPQPIPALAIGALVGDYEVYHFFPLEDDVKTLSAVQQWLVVVGVALVLLLAAVASLVTRQVVTPVRLTRQAAERLAAGRLEERLKVRGEDDLARLATSFNEMASNLALKIHQLEELSQVQRQFVSDVSHELRTPLTTVRMAADLLYESREDFDPATARAAELMQNQLERFESMLADLLEISRYDAGAATLDIDSVDMRDVVLRAVGDSQPLAERRSTRLDLRLPGEPCMAEVDSRRVERILRNLLFNAIEHGEGRDIVVALGADRDAVAVAVRDHGVGLKPGEENMVFDRFWRADPSRARTIGGTGLGLAISREDAMLHGGWLQAWGMPGEGSQFRLSLPRQAGSELRGSPLPLVPPEVEMRRTWRGHATPVLSPAVEGAFDAD
ncbi:two-component sensor histidine kinase [Sphaerisporangium krabiense]|uniref:Sensor histidine kinase MtrB n=1 Tax=Sphaerisporangium krabiense TaxID=763782 RepID=A0A7W8YZY2_9ACTN|nr:MtrAB system histidine kinase MtrB [Sphaerisporangium krabiense]MBB5624630.1 two-component system sensor histidine kinase MtrB [Sphaerisporangium krabiense]GII61413.1 two-component sensor histidine kinase [Sphaerisporangium krabiense]